jgi:hypothetical protein
MGVLNNLFGRGRGDIADLTRKTAMRPYPVDKTGGYPCNAETLKGLYDGTKAGLQNASPLARPPITIPTSIVGIPTPIGSDDQTKEAIKILIAQNSDMFTTITRTKCLYGTTWVWPRYDARASKLIWELIPDETIEAIGINPSTSEVLTIWTHEQFMVSTGNGHTEYSERKRKITKDYIEVNWLRKGSDGVYDNETYRNVFASMPISFPHAAEVNQPRGRSVLGANMRTYKTYHDIMQNACEILAELQPKFNISTDDIASWLTNNGFDGVKHANDTMYDSRFYLSKTGEAAQMIFLSSDALKGHMDMLTQLRQNLIIGSDIPEIFWPSLAVGNMASTDIQKDNGVAAIRSLQNEDTSSYNQLFNKSLEILSFVETRRYGTVDTRWGAFSLVAPETKATIFSTMAQGLAALYNVAGFTLEDAYYFIKGTYPDMPEEDAKTFISGLKATAKHKAFTMTDAISQNENGGEV